MPGNFYSVFHRFGATVCKQGHLGETSRRDRADPFGELRIPFIHDDIKTGMGKLFRLIPDGGDYPGVAVADVHNPDSPGKIDKLAAFHVINQCSPGAACKKRGTMRRTLRHKSVSKILKT